MPNKVFVGVGVVIIIVVVVITVDIVVAIVVIVIIVTRNLTSMAHVLSRVCAHLSMDLHEIQNLSSKDSNWPPNKIS